jgi:8-oxo-dGTP pyrophosphatase MutT (NUDIX family)
MYRHTHTQRSCVNCGKRGHITHGCNQPITSYGLILLDLLTTPGTPRFLMICRKDSFGFIDLVRGKYSPSSVTQVQAICDSMTVDERAFVRCHTFPELLQRLWGPQSTRSGKSAEQAAEVKFEQIRHGIKVKSGATVSLDQLLDEVSTDWRDPEWEFPKGRRNPGERDFECAVREFHEETGLLAADVDLITNLQPVAVTFSANKKQYTYKYFLAIAPNADALDLTRFQVEEVSQLEWKSAAECVDSLRSHDEKKELVEKIASVVRHYQFIYVPLY